MVGAVKNDELRVRNIFSKELALIRNFFVSVSPNDGGGGRDFFKKKSKILVDDFFEERTMLGRCTVIISGSDLFNEESEKGLRKNFFKKVELVIDEDFYFLFLGFLTNGGGREKDEMFESFGVSGSEMSGNLTTK